jgi:hypothetical protein
VNENPEAGTHDQPETSTEATAGAASWDDLQVGFCGNPKAKLDERGRLKMPADFKSFIEKKYGKGFNAFYITSRDGTDAEIYPMPEFSGCPRVFRRGKSCWKGTASSATGPTWIRRAACSFPRNFATREW